jgi:hypothetical protein
MAKAGNQSNKQPRLSAVLAMLWRTFRRDAFDDYRPELHYMRGPGPKWRTKHSSLAADTTPSLANTAAA